MCERLLDASVEYIEGAGERDRLGTMAGQDGGESGSQESVVGSGEEESGAPSEIGDAISMAVWQTLDHVVQAQAAELISDGAAADGLG